MGLPTTEDKIAAAEESLGRRLPDALRSRLLSNNGGDVEVTGDAAVEGEPDVWQLFSVWDDSSRDTMRRSATHIVERQQSAREWPEFPENAIAFAEDGGGNFLILDADNATLLWFHETGETFPVDVAWRR